MCSERRRMLGVTSQSCFVGGRPQCRLSSTMVPCSAGPCTVAQRVWVIARCTVAFALGRQWGCKVVAAKVCCTLDPAIRTSGAPSNYLCHAASC